MKKKETFIDGLQVLLQKAMKNNLIGQAIKIQEMIGKCQGFFSNKAQQSIEVSDMPLSNLESLLSQIKRLLQLES